MDFGGEMKFNVSGRPITVRGNVRTMPSNMSSEGIVNQDNTTSRSFRPMGYRAELTFENGDGIDWDALIKAAPQRFSLIQDRTGFVHVWISAKFMGDAQIDEITGEVTGLTILADGYQKATA